jgi:CO/xanthine dehydrogenase Mo-binding subunit
MENKMRQIQSLSRRGLLKSGGVMIVSFTLGRGLAQGPPPGGPGGPGGGRGPATQPDVDSFLAIHADGTVTILTSHVDVGTGLMTVLRQTAAEELGIPVERFNVIEGDTAITPDHGGTGGSSGVPRGAADIRRAAATARQALLGLGADQLKRPVSELTIANGEVRPTGGGTGAAVATLIGGKRFAIKVDANAPLKDPATYTVIGKPILRTDIPGKTTGRHVYVQDLTAPGMMHGRVVRPPALQAKIVSVDETSIRAIPDVRVVRIENFLGVVAKDEWAAVRAARGLKVTWSDWQGLAGSDTLERTMATEPSIRDQVAVNRGDTTAARAGATKRISATYYWPFQSHASLGPSCVVADVKESGTTVWSPTQDTFGLRRILAGTFGMQPDKVRVVYMDGSGSYGSNGAYDAAADAVLLSRAVGQPVRLQWMRGDELARDPKGPAQLLELHGGLDAQGNLVAWETNTRGASGPQWSGALLGPEAAGLIQAPAAGGGGVPVTQNADPPYAVANLRVNAHGLKDTAVRLSNLRAPGKIANVFAVESFTDELAAAAGMDPVAFRKRGLTDPRALAVIERAATMMDWQARPSPNRPAANGLQTGRGIAYMRYKQMENYVAIAMEVAVDRASGKISVRRITCAHDCGLIVNPDGLRNQVEGNIMHTLSRSLHEEVTFDQSKVTSVDWRTYPILTFPEAPAIQVELINHPDQPSYGAGEAACAPVTAALANAIFDATGVRLRSVPFTPEKWKLAVG